MQRNDDFTKLKVLTTYACRDQNETDCVRAENLSMHVDRAPVLPLQGRVVFRELTSLYTSQVL